MVVFELGFCRNGALLTRWAGQRVGVTGMAGVLHLLFKGYQGKAGMVPAKGGNTALDDVDVKAAVDYMISKAK